jgi:hypothetical protein
MSAHVVTLYDELQRVVLLYEELSGDPASIQVRLMLNPDLSSYLLLVENGIKRKIQLNGKGVKIPPSTGTEDFIESIVEKLKIDANKLLQDS